ncbi:MAG: ATP-dependent zinc metalloprotease FtsH [Pelovirga sp.]
MVLLLFLNGLYTLMLPPQPTEETAAIGYSLFKQLLKDDQIAEVTLEDDKLSGHFYNPVDLAPEQRINAVTREIESFERFETVLPPVTDTELLPLLEEYRVAFKAKKSEEPPYWLVNLLPWFIIIGIWLFILSRARKQGGLTGGLLNKMGESGARLYTREKSPVTFANVAGQAEAKQELQEIIIYLRHPEKFSRLGGQVPRGVLLSGPPGTGKTLMAKAVAGEAEVPFYSISASQFIEMFVGVGASRVRNLFNTAKKNAPSIIFVDELDAVGRARGTGLGGGNDEREQTLNQLLSELDGFDPHDEVIVLAATNRPDVLDAALLRPGRFDRLVVIGRPDWRDRVEILKVHTRKVPLADDVELEVIAKGTPGMVGADLRSLVNEAALIAAREDDDMVRMSHMEQAKDRQLMGMERKLFMSDLERHITAVHEAGHALVAKALPDTDPIHKITIIPRGQALGITQQLPTDDRYHYNRSYLLNRISVMLGGRVAEHLIFEETSSGAQNDLKQVMDLAEKMVCQWGMSERLGPLSYPRGEEHPFLGRKLSTEKTFSERTAWIIDQEIKQLVNAAETTAREVLSANRELLDLLAQRLLEEESLDQQAFERFLQDNGEIQLPGQTD